jgi:hypothetical protein
MTDEEVQEIIALVQEGLMPGKARFPLTKRTLTLLREAKDLAQNTDKSCKASDEVGD